MVPNRDGDGKHRQMDVEPDTVVETFAMALPSRGSRTVSDQRAAASGTELPSSPDLGGEAGGRDATDRASAIRRSLIRSRRLVLDVREELVRESLARAE